jgi:hypothetical protein
VIARRSPGAVSRATSPIPPGVAIAAALVLGGCAAQLAHPDSIAETPAPAALAGPMEVRVERCVDRTGFTDRDLGAETTAALVTKLRAAGPFVVTDQGRYVLACDITGFVEGSAFKRWLLPGWGTTVGRIAVMVTDSRSGDTVAIVRASATVSAGGLYSVGADQIILAAAVDDVVKQLQTLAAQAAAAKKE